MAIKNRSEVSDAIQAQAATVGETEYKDNLDTEMTQNLVFRKDVADTDTANAASKTIDFLDIDYFEITQNAATVAYTLNNVQQGEIKFLKITKTANQEINFVNATDVSARKEFITTQTSVIYRIINKDGTLYIESISIDNARTLETKVVEIGDWDMDATIAVSIAHGLSDHTKIRSVNVIVRDDADIVYSNIGYGTNSITVAGWIGVIGVGTIGIERLTGGFFDNTTYNSTSYNRGFITIQYEI